MNIKIIKVLMVHILNFNNIIIVNKSDFFHVYLGVHGVSAAWLVW